MPVIVDANFLSGLSPFQDVSEHNRERLAEIAIVDEYPAGGVICKAGDTDDFALYVVEGSVEMSARASTLKRRVTAGDEEATFALAPTRPREYGITALPGARILRLENQVISRLLVFDEITTTVSDIRGSEQRSFGGDSRWVEEMSRRAAFQALPREKLGPLMMRMEAIAIANGETVVRQGDRGDFYFIVKEGKLVVTRKDEQGRVKLLGEMTRGDVFGEEALISGEARNATIVAVADGILMRLAKNDFDELLKKPLIVHINLDEARRLARTGAGLLDVRTTEEYARAPLKGSVNIPVADLRARLGELDSARSYVVCCRTGVKSEVAAFLLRQRGFEVYVLDGGIEKNVSRKHPADTSA